jgi:hypothetical protein
MSSATFNLISARNNIFNETSNDWVGLNSTLLRSGTKIYQPTLNRNSDVSLAYFAISVHPVDNTQKFGTRLSLNSLGSTYNNTWVQAHMAVFCQSTITVDCNIVIDGVASIDNDPPLSRRTDIVGGKWTIIRSPQLKLPDDTSTHSVDIIINSVDTTTSPIYVSIPALIPINQLFKNQVVYNTLRAMPQFYWEHDQEDGDPSKTDGPAFLLRRFLDLGLSEANEALLLYLQYIRFSKEDGFDPDNALMPVTKRSSLVDPLAADEATIKWLAQFAGRQLVDSRDIFASRLNFPQDDATIDLNIDYTATALSGVTLTREAGTVVTNTASIDTAFYSGTGVVRVKSDSSTDQTFDGIFILKDITDSTKLTWTQDEYDATSASTVTISEITYDSITKYATNRHAFNQYQVDSRHFGISSGTITSLNATVQELLSGTKELALSYDEQWVIGIQTRMDETPTYLLSTNEFSVLDSIITPIIPAGHIADYSMFPSDGGSRLALDEDPEGRLNLYALGNP